MNVTAPNQHDQLVKTARVWVSQTFFGEMLKQMHNSPFKTELSSGGRGAEAFQSQLDQRLAERMARSGAGERLVQSIVKKIENRTGNSYVAPRD
jgi:Rod binding domain-containing protein